MFEGFYGGVLVVEMSRPVMVGLIILAALALWTLYGVYVSMNLIESKYEVLEILEGGVEIREYPEEIWATTSASDQNQAFSPLFRYISGDNDRAEKIEMTAPVVTWTEEGRLVMAFVMPERFRLDTLPRPSSDRVEIEAVAPRKLAAIRFSGYATKESREKNLRQLKEILEAHEIPTEGEPILMQYNDPWTPPYLRRNEVALELELG